MCNKHRENANDNNSAGNLPYVICFSISMVVDELFHDIEVMVQFQPGMF